MTSLTQEDIGNISRFLMKHYREDLRGADGFNGSDGKDGPSGPPGSDGTNGRDGRNGRNGMDGRDGDGRGDSSNSQYQTLLLEMNGLRLKVAQLESQLGIQGQEGKEPFMVPAGPFPAGPFPMAPPLSEPPAYQPTPAPPVYSRVEQPELRFGEPVIHIPLALPQHGYSDMI